MEEFDLNSLKKKVLRKYPAFGTILSSVKYEIVDNSSEFPTAGTNGKLIKINKDFMNSLSENEQIFVLAHEICHIAFEHIERRKDKDPTLWNIATDAIINKNLEHDGLSIPQNGVNIADAINYDAEELYEKLLKEQEKQKSKQNQNSKSGDNSKNSNGQNDNQQNNNQQNNDQNGNSGNQVNEHVGHDDHGMWDEKTEQKENEQNNDKSDPKNKNDNNQNGNNEKQQKINEKQIFKENREQVEKQAQDVLDGLMSHSKGRGFGGESQLESIGNVGSAKNPVVNWKKLLRKELEIEDEKWGYKFSDKGNNYSPRLEDYEYEESAQTEIILDTSGSVSIELLKGFLRQMKTILVHSKIKVATFASDFHNDWREIKSQKDIDNLRLYIGGGTNFDAASRAFTKDPRVNKICFTDGDDGGDAMIMNKRKDIIWISFENPYFRPDHGKVIFVNPCELSRFIKSPKQDDDMDMEF